MNRRLKYFSGMSKNVFSRQIKTKEISLRDVLNKKIRSELFEKF